MHPNYASELREIRMAIIVIDCTNALHSFSEQRHASLNAGMFDKMPIQSQLRR